MHLSPPHSIDPSLVDWHLPIDPWHPLNDRLVCDFEALPLTSGGTTWFDLTGRHDGTFNTLTIADWLAAWALPGAAYALDYQGGTGDRVDAGTFHVAGDEITIQAFVRLDSVSGSRDDRFVSKADGTSSANHDWMLGHQQSSSKDRMRARIARGGGTAYGNSSVSSNCVGSLCQFALTYNANTSPRVNLYLNGVADTPYSYKDSFGVDQSTEDLAGVGSGSLPTNANSVLIGNQPVSLTNAPDGKIAAVLIHAKALSADEILWFNDEVRRGNPGRLRRYRGAPIFVGGASFTGSAPLTADAATFTGTATFAPGTKTGSATLTVAAATFAGSATFDDELRTGTATLTADAATFAGVATYAPGIKTASASLTADAATFTGAATFATGTKTATASLTADAATFAGVATYAPGIKTASATLTVAAATLAGSATFAAPVYDGVAALVTRAATFSGSGLTTAPGASLSTGTAALTAAAATLGGSATFTSDVIGRVGISYRATGGRLDVRAIGGRLDVRATGGRIDYRAKGGN